MSKLNLLKAKNDILEALLFVATFVLLFQINVRVLFAIWPSDAERNVKCSDTICDVRIIDHMCFAKDAKTNTSKFSRVDCDIYRSGLYDITLPCNIDKYGRCMIDCRESIFIKGFWCFILSCTATFICFLIIACGSVSACLINDYRQISSEYEENGSDIADKKKKT